MPEEQDDERLLRIYALISARVEVLLEQRELKQDVLAAVLGVEQGTISKLLKGRKDGTRPAWTLEYLDKVSHYFRCPIAFFVPSDRETETGKLEPRELPGPRVLPGRGRRAS